MMAVKGQSPHLFWISLGPSYPGAGAFKGSDAKSKVCNTRIATLDTNNCRWVYTEDTRVLSNIIFYLLQVLYLMFERAYESETQKPDTPGSFWTFRV